MASCDKKTVTTKVAAETKDSYPLTTCVVSGEKLGEMGEPHVIVR